MRVRWPLISDLYCTFEKVTMPVKNPSILWFFFVIKRTQLNSVHTQLLEKLRQGAFTERFQTVQMIEFHENYQKNKTVQKPSKWSITKFLNVQFQKISIPPTEGIFPVTPHPLWIFQNQLTQWTPTPPEIPFLSHTPWKYYHSLWKPKISYFKRKILNFDPYLKDPDCRICDMKVIDLIPSIPLYNFDKTAYSLKKVHFQDHWERKAEKETFHWPL